MAAGASVLRPSIGVAWYLPFWISQDEVIRRVEHLERFWFDEYAVRDVMCIACFTNRGLSHPRSDSHNA